MISHLCKNHVDHVQSFHCLAEITTAGQSRPCQKPLCMKKTIGTITGTKNKTKNKTSDRITLVLKHVIINYTRSNSSHSRANVGCGADVSKPNNPVLLSLFTCTCVARQSLKDSLPTAFSPSFLVAGRVSLSNRDVL